MPYSIPLLWRAFTPPWKDCKADQGHFSGKFDDYSGGMAFPGKAAWSGLEWTPADTKRHPSGTPALPGITSLTSDGLSAPQRSVEEDVGWITAMRPFVWAI